MHTKIGHCPSCAWRSLLAGRSILLAGLIWRIGDERKVKIWKDKWIYYPLSNQILSPPHVLNEEAIVHELIDI